MMRIESALSGGVRRVVRWYFGLSRGLLVGLSSVVALVLILSSVGMYRAYDYVQHDNDFCTSCHLMADPFERFQRSAHRGLGCKACHRPNMWERTSMALVQILERPDSMTRHAHVPSQLCGECHIDGNPEEWKIIAASAGHRIHLESDDPKLEKIECLTCHGAGVHNFTAAEQTCGQAECHTNNKVQLAGMSNLTIHCASCHDFSRPVAKQVARDSVNDQLTPRRNDCLSCHAMREQVAASIPKDEPHNGTCGTCHNPHEQDTPAAAVAACASGGCHQQVDTVSVMHRNLGSGVLQNCTSCHRAHNWKTKGSDCTSCHTPETLDNPRRKPIKRLHAGVVQQSVFDVFLAPYRVIFAALAEPPFRHKLHTSIACTTCHTSEDGHGVLKINTAADCQGCHHGGDNLNRCKSCHTTNESAGSFRRSFSWKLTVWKAPRQRALSFEHKQHGATTCMTCHKREASLRASVSCTSCHVEHHDAARNCTSCHAATDLKAVQEHTAKVHLSCSSSGCHQDKVTATLRTQRNVCLTCHSAQADHEPQGDCASCHLIPKRAKEFRP